MIQPFPIDADEFDLHDVEQDPSVLAIHLNPEIEEFLEKEGPQAKCVLVGGKGYGKTLLLKKKAVQYRQPDSGHTCVPSDRLCEKISSFLLEVDPAWFAELAKTETWIAVWEVTLAASICRATDTQLPQQIARLVPMAVTSPSDVVSHLSRGMKSLNACKGIVGFARAALRGVTSRTACFIDNIDEGLKHLLGRDEARPGMTAPAEGNGPLEQIWIAAQLGLLEAIRELRNINRRIKIFATIRQEAFDRYDFQTRAQVRENCAFLSYTNDELLTIFRSRCRLVPAANCAKPKEADDLFRFLGLKQVRMRAEATVEDVSQFILRHTLGRPRDLMRMGSALYQARPSSTTFDEARLVRSVLSESSEIYSDYKVECVPYWCGDYESVFSLCGPMILTSSEVHRIAHEFEGVNPELPHPFCYFYFHGLLGAIGRDVDGRLIQNFCAAGGYVSNSTIALPKSMAYFFHPCLGSAVANATLHRAKDESTSLDDLMLVGRGLAIPDQFVAKLQQQDAPLLVRVSEGTLRIELEEHPGHRLWKLQSISVVLLASALVAFQRARSPRVRFEQIGQVVDELVSKGNISVHNITAHMAAGATSLGDAIVQSLKDDKCRPLEDAVRRLRELYSAQVLMREKGWMLLSVVDPTSLRVTID